jgi:hypothetical protein
MAGLITALILQAKLDRAHQENQRMLEIYGESATRLRLEGDAAFFENRPDDALSAYRKSLAMYSQQPKIEQRVTDLQEFLTSAP